MSAQQPVGVSYAELQNANESVQSKIHDGLGSDPGCLGIILVKGVLFACLPACVYDRSIIVFEGHLLLSGVVREENHCAKSVYCDAP